MLRKLKEGDEVFIYNVFGIAKSFDDFLVKVSKLHKKKVIFSFLDYSWANSNTMEVFSGILKFNEDVKKTKRKKVSREEAMEKLKEIAPLFDQDLAKVIKATSIFQQFNDEKVVEKINKIHAGDIFNVCSLAMQNFLIGSLHNLFDEPGKNKVCFKLILSLLEDTSVREQLTMEYFQGNRKQFEDLYERTKEEFDEIVEKDERIIVQIKSYRNIVGYHTLMKELNMKGCRYNDIYGLSNKISRVGYQLFCCITGTYVDCDEEIKKICKKGIKNVLLQCLSKP